MDHKDLEFFRKLLSEMLEEAQQKGDSTIEELTDSNEVFADPADRATAESDRAFTLRIRARFRPPDNASTTAPTASARNAARKSAFPASKPGR